MANQAGCVRRVARGARGRARLSICAGVLSALLVSGPHLAAADVVLDWNVELLKTLAMQNPFAAARYAAITQLAVFEAVNATIGDYHSYIGPFSAPAGASTDAAAAAAAHAVLVAYFPAKAAELDGLLANSLAQIPDGQSKTDGITTGEAAASVIMALRSHDGSAAPGFYLPASHNPGEWQVTPSCPLAGGLFANWPKITPFGLPSVDPFIPGPPPLLTTAEYRKDYNEVKSVGADDSALRPADRSDVARFYASFSPVTWANVALQQVAAAQGGSVSENARAFALVNMAISDAAVASFATKYRYKFWRPETAIRAGDTDGNRKTDPDLAYMPFIVTPCFPSYPSNHATLSYAARAVLENLYGPNGHDITFSSTAVAGVTLHYTRFEDITSDIDDARVFGGIHFRFDQETGARMGRRIGEYVYKHNLRVVRP